MGIKKRFAVMISGSTFFLASLICASTYAYLSSSVKSSSNIFAVSHNNMKIKSYRHDIPLEGPMFYINSGPDGISCTGYWKQGKKEERGLFIESEGTGDATLSKIYGYVADFNDKPVNYSTLDQAQKNFMSNLLVTVNIFIPKEKGKETYNRYAYEVALNQLSDAFEADIQGSGVPVNTLSEEQIISTYDKVFKQLQNVEFFSKHYHKTLFCSSLNGTLLDGIGPASSQNFDDNYSVELPAGGMIYLGYEVRYKNDKNIYTHNNVYPINIRYTFAHEFRQK